VDGGEKTFFMKRAQNFHAQERGERMWVFKRILHIFDS